MAVCTSHDMNKYYIETRDKRERWHRPRVPQYLSASAAIKAGVELMYGTDATAYRIINSETREIEYTEIRRYEGLEEYICSQGC